MPSAEGDDDGLTRAQWRRLLVVAAAIGVVMVLGVVAITAASHVWGTGGGQEGPPSAAFSVETVEDEGDVAVVITHEGGDGIHPPYVHVVVDDVERGTWNELGGGGADVVTPDATLRLGDVSPGERVLVVYDDGADRAELGRGTVAEQTR